MKEKKKRKVKSIEELTKGIEEFQKKKGMSPTGKKDFERTLRNAVKPHDSK